ncbi:MAG: hypothetical protein ACR2KQ_07850 [Actinomycetota bacterium]
MNYALLLSGIVLVLVVGYDIIQTALRVGQADEARRSRLRWLVQDTGWTWSDVTGK